MSWLEMKKARIAVINFCSCMSNAGAFAGWFPAPGFSLYRGKMLMVLQKKYTIRC